MRHRLAAVPALAGLAACLTAAALFHGCREVTRVPSPGPGGQSSLEAGEVLYPTVTIQPRVDSLLVGDTTTLRARLFDPGHIPDSWWGRCVDWTTTDSNVVAVDFSPTGTRCVPETDTSASKPAHLRAKQAGVAVITAATQDGTSGSDTIRVVQPPAPPVIAIA